MARVRRAEMKRRSSHELSRLAETLLCVYNPDPQAQSLIGLKLDFGARDFSLHAYWIPDSVLIESFHDRHGLQHLSAMQTRRS